MALKETNQILKSSFTEDDVYFYSREEELSSKAEDILNNSDSSNPLWYLHPSDEDNGFVKLGDFIPRRSGSSGDFGAQAAA